MLLYVLGGKGGGVRADRPAGTHRDVLDEPVVVATVGVACDVIQDHHSLKEVLQMLAGLRLQRVQIKLL